MKEGRCREIARIAYLYYYEEMTQAAIARIMNVDRTTVSRMLSEARKENIVEIKINDHNSSLFKLEAELKRKYKLNYLEIVPNFEGQSDQHKDDRLSMAASSYIKRQVVNNMVIGVSWGRTLSHMTNQMEGKALSGVTVVPVVGGPSHVNVAYHVNTIVYNLAHKFNADSVFVNATVVQEHEYLTNAIYKSKYFKELLSYWNKLDMVILGVGDSLYSNESKWRDLVTEDDFKQLKNHGAIGDCCCRFYNLNGQEIDVALHRRIVGISLEEIGDVAKSVAVARGKEKAVSILGLMNSGYVKSIITDQETVEEILNYEKNNEV